MTFLPPKNWKNLPLSFYLLSPPIQSNEATLYTLWCLSFPLPNFYSPTNIASITNLNTINIITLDQTSTSSYLNISPSSTHYHIPKLPPFLRPPIPQYSILDNINFDWEVPGEDWGLIIQLSVTPCHFLCFIMHFFSGVLDISSPVPSLSVGESLRSVQWEKLWSF